MRLGVCKRRLIYSFLLLCSFEPHITRVGDLRWWKSQIQKKAWMVKEGMQKTWLIKRCWKIDDQAIARKR
ncbi:hypothetical protein HanPSC8_Chr08g0331001 [Helianthus annuus]|nr:hypothetical protein HanPSC8_Chr08g0331001 [Helianthus annuus]